VFGKWIVGQGHTAEKFLDKLKQSIESFGELYKSEYDVYLSPIYIN
jgi:hypothetical protein